MTNSVIVYISRTQDLHYLLRSITLLGKNFKYIRDYPIVVFHDDISKVSVSSFYVNLHRELGFIPNITFEQMAFEFPDGFIFDETKVDSDAPMSRFWLGYRHMCRFQSLSIYRHPIMAKYDYYWRLDSDSYLLSPIDYDPFQYMVDHGYEYAFVGDEDCDPPTMVKGLWDATKEWIDREGIDASNVTKRFVDGQWQSNLFYTNFEIGKLSFWRSEKYQSYVNHLDSTGGFYYKRWGDAPVHWLAVRMLMDDSKVWCVDNMAYMHSEWIRNLKSVPEAAITPNMEKYVDPQRLPVLKYAMARYQKTGIDKNSFGERYDEQYQ